VNYVTLVPWGAGTRLRGCRTGSRRAVTGSYTDFSLREDGKINIVNSCRDEKDGSLRQTKGRVWVEDPANSGRLKVSFFFGRFAATAG
jgi:lipocalin